MTVHETHPDRPDIIDLRSDTVTQPTDAMRHAMATAPVGDDLFGEDPTVAHLEATAAGKLGHDAGLFMPTGSMANLTAILAHTGGHSEIIAERRAHILNYEAGSVSALAGCHIYPLDVPGGVYTARHLEGAIRPPVFIHPEQRLAVIENTANGWGGSVWTPGATRAVTDAAHAHRLKVHCDGARIFNAAAALGISPDRLADGPDSVMFCFSKGLSAPVGSMLVGDAAFIERARRVRKQLGGAMRQAGVLAAAAQVALDTMVERLGEDHRQAKALAIALADAGYGLDPDAVSTNIVVFDVRPHHDSASDFVGAARRHGLLALPVGPTEVRLVTHRHITDAKTEAALAILRQTARGA